MLVLEVIEIRYLMRASKNIYFSLVLKQKYLKFFQLINLLAPLAELSGYSSALRIISSGGASMSMQPSGYALMTASEEASAIRRAQGLE